MFQCQQLSPALQTFMLTAAVWRLYGKNQTFLHTLLKLLRALMPYGIATRIYINSCNVSQPTLCFVEDN